MVSPLIEQNAQFLQFMLLQFILFETEQMLLLWSGEVSLEKFFKLL
jgi:hypothetical protein